MEIAGLAVVDVKNHTAFHYYATQTKLEDCQNLLSYYADIIIKDALNMLLVAKYVTVDAECRPAYFSKSTIIDPVGKEGFEPISRMRNDAVMFDPCLGPQRKGRGRKKNLRVKSMLKILMNLNS